jgi:hypothetical protein
VYDGSTDAGSALYDSAEDSPAPGTPWTFNARVAAVQVVTSAGTRVIHPISMAIFFEVTATDHRRLLVELASNGTRADLFVNGLLVQSGYPGFVQSTVPGRVLWGAGSSTAIGAASWANVDYVTGTQ